MLHNVAEGSSFNKLLEEFNFLIQKRSRKNSIIFSEAVIMLFQPMLLS